MKTLLTGASGMIGTALKAELLDQGHEVRTLTRSDGGDYRWDAQPGSVPVDSLVWADALVSLNGASLSHLPWTKAYRHQILTSRVNATSALATAIAAADNPPSVWVSASAIGFYGDGGDADLDETTPVGKGFLAEVVQAWEQSTNPAQAATRVVRARTGLVLAAQGALKPLAMATRVGLGARVGPGTQWWGWVSLTDEVRAIVFALTHPSITGPMNLVGPTPATSLTISRALARALHRPHWLILPSQVIRTTMAGAHELLLASQRIHPKVLQEAGFTFHYQDAETAIKATYN